MLTAVKRYFADNSAFALTARSGGRALMPSSEERSAQVKTIDELFLHKNTSSGKLVTHNSALGVTAVWSAVRIIAEGVASLSHSVFEDDEDGNRVARPDHYVAKLMHTPSPSFDGYTFLEMLVSSAALTGNGIAHIRRDGAYRPIGLDFYPTERIQIITHKGHRFYQLYDYANNDVITAWPEDVLHLRAWVQDPVTGWGLSPITVHRETFGTALANQEFAAKFYENGAHISGFLSTDQKLSDPALERLAKSWKLRYSGSVNAGGTPILEEGLTYHPLSLSPKDAAHLETAKMSVEDIARIFRVPLHMMASLDRATFSNIEHQGREYVTNTLRPWVKRLEGELKSKLFSTRSRAYVRFDLNSLLRGDTQARAKLYDSYLKWGILSVNEVRKLEGFNPIKGGEGDTHLYPVNMAPFGMLTGPQSKDKTDEEE